MPHIHVSAASSLTNHSSGVCYGSVEDDDRDATAYDSSSSEDEIQAAKQAAKTPRWTLASVKRYLSSEVDESRVSPLLMSYGFMTGYIDAITFSSIFVWSGFQTGNFAQVGLAVANAINAILSSPHSLASYYIPQNVQQAICSLAAFLLGVLLFGRLGDWIGPHKRGWLFVGTLVQAILTMLSAVTFWHLDGGWTIPTVPPLASDRLVGSIMGNTGTGPIVRMEHFFATACLSASFGMQGVMARRLNTFFGNTVVLTGVFVDLVSEPTLFQVTRPRRARDEMFLASMALFCGVVVGRLVLGKLGVALTVGAGAILRAGVAVAWLTIPAMHVHLP